MSEQAEALETKHAFVTFSRKINDGNYGGAEFSLMVPFVWDTSDSEEAMAANDLAANLASIQTKTVVYRQLGIDTTIAEDGTIMEANAVAKLLAEFPGSTVQKSTPAASGGGQSSAPRPAAGGGGGGTSIKVFKRLELDGEKVPNPDWLKAQIEAAVGTKNAITLSGGSYELWDNRRSLTRFGGDRSGNLPWFKDKNGEGAIWPPKGHPDSN